MIGRTLNGTIWDLHSLADEILGSRIQTAKVFDLKAQAARRGRKSHSLAKGSIYAWWHIVTRTSAPSPGITGLAAYPKGGGGMPSCS